MPRISKDLSSGGENQRRSLVLIHTGTSSIPDAQKRYAADVRVIKTILSDLEVDCMPRGIVSIGFRGAWGTYIGENT